MVDIAGLPFGENLLQRNIHSFPILGMDDVKKRIKSPIEVLRPDPDQTAELGRGSKPIDVGPPFPVSDLGDPLSQPKARLALAQRIERLAAPKHVLDAVAENSRIQRFRNKICGTALIGRGDRFGIVESRHDQDRHPAATHQFSQLRAGGEPIHSWHHNVQEHDVGPILDESLKGLRAVLRLTHLVAG